MKKEKGSVTLFVLIACMFMIVILLIVNIGIMNKNRSEEKKIEEIAKQYNQNETDLDNIYEETVDNQGYITREEYEDSLYYKPGDICEMGTISTAGFIINSSKNYRFTVFLDKKISKDVKSINIRA